MENKNRLIELFISLASISSVSGDERAIADYIKSFLKKLGLSPEEDISLIKDGCNTGNLICKIGSGGDFILLSHLDTARPTEGMKPIIQNDKLTSDGTTVLGVDDRAGIAAILYAVENIINSNIPHNDFTIGFTVCEETTLYGSLNFKIPDFIKMGFIFDSSYRPGFYIEKTPGAKSFTINIRGRASHSGIAPEKGINSLVTAAKAITSLDWGRIDPETTANIGKINGGTAINVIPELTSLTGEVRSFNSEKIDYHINLIKNKFEESARNTGAEIEFSSEWDFYPYSINENSDVCKKLVKAMKDSNLTPLPTLSFGGSDANSFNSRGLPSINIGIGAQNPHSNDEFILIEDLYKAAEIAMNLIRK